MNRPNRPSGKLPCCCSTIAFAMLVAIIGLGISDGVSAAQAAPGGSGNTFQLSAPRHQQQQQHRQHHHHHQQHHHRHRKPTPLFGGGGGVGPLFGGRNVSGHTVATTHSPWSSHSILLTANKTNAAGAEPKSSSSMASASATAYSTGIGAVPLKLTLISASSSSSSSSASHSQVPRGDSMATAVINHQAHQWWQRSADPRTPPAATAVATPNLRELQPATSRSTMGRHVCVEHQPAPITPPPMVLANAHPHSLFSEFWQHEIFGDAGGSTIPAARPSIAVHKCCPGWAQISRNSHGCTKPICQPSCQNGGKCVKPDVCSCPAGFHGRNCELDRNECSERKPCDQYCHNTAGSFYCSCRAGFTLAPDGESCRRLATDAEARDSNAFEARDMENDVQPDYGGRVERMERTLVAERKLSADLGQKVVAATALVQNLKQRLESLEQRQQEVLRMRDQLSAQETQSRRLEYIVEQLYKCRSKNSVFCTLQ